MYDTEGTREFMAPECITETNNGYFGFPTDIWSFGVSLLVFLTGQLPFTGENEIEVQVNAHTKDPEIPN